MANLNLRNPAGYSGTLATQFKQGIVRFATLAEAAAGEMDNVAITPATAQAATVLDFASPPVAGFGSVTPRPVSATTFTATGDLVSSTAGNGLVLNSPSASGAAASPVVVNGRSGRATFTSVSIAAAADLTLTITNSSITAATTQVLLSMSGATTGSALSIKSKTASSGSLAIVVTNGTGATTTTADIQIDFLVLNA